MTQPYLGRILFVHHGIGLGGAPIYLHSILKALDNKFKKIVVMRQSSAVDIIRETGSDIKIVKTIPTFRHTTAGWYSPINPISYIELLHSYALQSNWKHLFLKYKPDIIHLNSVTLLPLCKPARYSGAKVIVSVQETVLNGFIGVRKKWIRNQLTKYADAILYISNYDRNLLDVDVPIIEVVPNWVDLQYFRYELTGEGIRKEIGISPNQKLIISLGGTARIKGTLYFLQAAKKLENRKDLIFAIIGLDPPPDEYRHLKSKLRKNLKQILGIGFKEEIYDYYFKYGLSKNVLFLGLRRDIPDVIAASDAVIFPAIRPHQARPILEAGAMKKPVIASRFDCLSEFLSDGVNGYFVTPKSSDELAEVIVKLLDTPHLAENMGEANFRNTYNNHNQDINAPRVVEVFQKLLDS